MGSEENIQLVKAGYAAFGRGDVQGLIALLSDDVEWISPGEELVTSGTYRGHEGVSQFFQKLSDRTDILAFEPREFIAQADRVLVVGWERVRIKETNRTIDLDWVMSFTAAGGKITRFREYIDTQAIATASVLSSTAAGEAG